MPDWPRQGRSRYSVRLFLRIASAFAATVLLLGIAEAAAQQASAKAARVAVVISNLSNPFFSQISREVEAAVASTEPSATVSVMSSGYDLARQLSQIDAVVEQGYDLLIVNAVDTDKIARALERAKSAGVIVVALDVKATGAQLTVTSDNLRAGKIACDYLAARLGGRGDVVVLNGPPVSAVRDRVIGCKSALSSHPGIRLLSAEGNSGGSMLGGLTYMSALLARLPHVDAVFSVNDPAALGANEAARQAGREEFFIVSIDASPAAVHAMRQPGSRLVASVYQDPRAMAYRAVQMAFALRAGENVSSEPVLMPVELVTRETMDGFAPWGVSP